LDETEIRKLHIGGSQGSLGWGEDFILPIRFKELLGFLLIFLVSGFLLAFVIAGLIFASNLVHKSSAT
jgi:hypothetical protein